MKYAVRGTGMVLAGIFAAAQAQQGNVVSGAVAQCLDAKASQEAAIAACSRGIAGALKGTGLADLLSRRGDLWWQGRKYISAVADYREAIKHRTQPKLISVLHQKTARVLLQAGSPKEALDEATKAVEADPTNWAAIADRAELLALNNAPKQTVMAVMDSAVRAAPREAGPLIRRANLPVQFIDPRASLADMDSAIALAPTNAILLNDTCWMRVTVMRRDLERALQHCDAAVKLQPNNPHFRDRRGLANLKLKRWQAAWTDYNAAVQLTTPGEFHWRVLFGRGMAADKLGRSAEARSDIERANKAAPSAYQFFFSQGF